MRAKTFAAFAVLALAGCSGPAQTDKFATVDSLAELNTRHMELTCTITINAQNNGLHQTLDECAPKLVAGAISDADIEGEEDCFDNTGTWAANRETSTSITVYGPGNSGNTEVLAFPVVAEDDAVEICQFVVRVPPFGGFGTYDYRFVMHGFNDGDWWWGVAEEADDHQDVVSFVIDEEGWF